MGTLFYGSGGAALSLPDAVLVHLQAVAYTKLRRGESFALTWRHAPNDRPGKTTVWFDPAIPLRFVFDSEPPLLDPLLVHRLLDRANATSGLMIDLEVDVPAAPVRNEDSSGTADSHQGEPNITGKGGAPVPARERPVELAPAFVFLASEESSYVVGETIAVTGGMPVH